MLHDEPLQAPAVRLSLSSPPPCHPPVDICYRRQPFQSLAAAVKLQGIQAAYVGFAILLPCLFSIYLQPDICAEFSIGPVHYQKVRGGVDST